MAELSEFNQNKERTFNSFIVHSIKFIYSDYRFGFHVIFWRNTLFITPVSEQRLALVNSYCTIRPEIQKTLCYKN